VELPQAAHQAFEPLFTTKSADKGTGLGLSLVRETVEAFGGTVSLESTPGQGTIVSLELDRCAPPSPKRSSAPSQDKLHGSGLVVLAEDQPEVRRALRADLERTGFEVLEAPDGRSALGLVEHLGSTPHVLLTDVKMPRMDGVELASAVRQLHPDIGVVYVSGYASPEVNAAHLQAPRTRFLTKPCAANELCQMVNEVMPERAA